MQTKTTTARTVALTLAAWATLATASSAPDGGAEEGAFCDSVDAAASAEASTLATPEFVASSQFDQFHGTADDPFFHYERHVQNRVGLEYDLAALHKSALVKRVATAQCRSYKLDRRVSKSLDIIALKSKIQGLDVRRQILADEEKAIEARLNDAKSRLAAGAAGFSEVDGIGEATHALKTELAVVEAELARLRTMLPTGDVTAPAEMKGLLANWTDAQAEQWALEQQRVEADAWHVNLIGGMQSARYDGVERPGAYGGIEFRLNLGAVARANALDDARTARQSWLSMANDGAMRRGDIAFANAAAALADVKRRLAVENQRTDELQAFLEATSRLEASAAAANLDTNVRVKWLLSHALTESLKVEMAALIKLLEPDEAQAKEAEKTPPIAPPTAPKAAPPGAFTMKTDVPNFRWHQEKAVAAAESAAIRFRVTGKTAKQTKLASGDVREQLGLMLRFVNQCNLVYAMWRLGDSQIHVQEKSNPGQSTHAGCENNGYVTIKPIKAETLPALQIGEEHVIAAKIAANELVVTVDGKEMWRGPAPKIVKSGGGVGFRSDNLVVEYTLLD